MTAFYTAAIHFPEFPLTSWLYNPLYLLKVFEDFQGTFLKKFLERSVRQRLTTLKVLQTFAPRIPDPLNTGAGERPRCVTPLAG